MSDFPHLFARAESRIGPRCFWIINHRIDPEELTRQLREFAQKGFEGVILSPSPGTPPAFTPAEWMDAVSHCCTETRSLELEFWLHFDPLVLPFGTDKAAAGEHITSSASPSVNTAETKTLDWHPARGEMPVAVYAVRTDRSEIAEVWRIGRPLPLPLRWTPPEGNWVLIPLVRRKGRGLGVLNKDAVSKAIQSSLEPHAAEGIEGVFIGPGDVSSSRSSLEASAVPWSDIIPERFQAIGGGSIYDTLPHLLGDFGDESVPHRAAFWDVCSAIYSETFLEPLREFCEQRNWKLNWDCGDLPPSLSTPIVGGKILPPPPRSGEKTLQTRSFFLLPRDRGRCRRGLRSVSQTFCETANSDAVAKNRPLTSEVPLSRRERVRVRGDYWTPCRTINSAQRSAGVDIGKQSLTGPATLSDRAWSIQPTYVLRDAVDSLESGCPFHVARSALYSLDGYRKHEVDSLESRQSPFWDWYTYLTDAIEHISWLFQNSKPVRSVLVLDPQQSLFSRYGISSEPIDARTDWLTAFSGTCAELRSRGVSITVMDEEDLKRAGVRDSKIVLELKREPFDGLVLPGIEVISETTEKQIEIISEGKIPVLCLSTVPQIIQGNSLRPSKPLNALQPEAGVASFLDKLSERLPDSLPKNANRQIEIIQRQSEWGRLYVLVNRSESDTHLKQAIHLPGQGRFRFLNLVDGKTSSIDLLQQTQEGVDLQLDFEPGQTHVIVHSTEMLDGGSADSATRHQMVTRVEFADQFLFIPKLSNVFPLDRWDLSVSTGDRLHGPICRYLSEFVLADKISDLRLLCDGLGPTVFETGETAIEINGQRIEKFVPGRRFDRWILEADISDWIQPGVNQVRVLVRWSAGPPTGLYQAFWLAGDFLVRELQGLDVLTNRESSLTTGLGSWTDQGFPYYAGPAVYRQWATIPETMKHRRFYVRFESVKELVEVRVNGNIVDVLLGPPWRCEITDAVVLGENEFEFVVVNALDNALRLANRPSGLLGPVVLEAR